VWKLFEDPSYMLSACFDCVCLVVYFAGCQSVNHTFLMGFSVCMRRLACMLDSLRRKCWEIQGHTWLAPSL